MGMLVHLENYFLFVFELFCYGYDTPSDGSVTISEYTMPYVLMHMALIQKRK